LKYKDDIAKLNLKVVELTYLIDLNYNNNNKSNNHEHITQNDNNNLNNRILNESSNSLEFPLYEDYKSK